MEAQLARGRQQRSTASQAACAAEAVPWSLQEGVGQGMHRVGAPRGPEEQRDGGGGFTPGAYGRCAVLYSDLAPLLVLPREPTFALRWGLEPGRVVDAWALVSG